MDKNRKASIQKTFRFTPEFMEIMEAAKEATGHTNLTAVIIQAVGMLNRKENPLYKNLALARSMSPEDKVKRSEEIQEIKERSRRERQVKICEELGGETYDGSDGDVWVKYYKYFENYRERVDLPLNDLSAEMIKDQYFPDKEDVLRRQKEGKTKYTLENETE
jgi:hypothetical protein